MKEIASNIKYATYLDKFEVVSFIEKCLFENKLGFFPLSNDEDLLFFDKILSVYVVFAVFYNKKN